MLPHPQLEITARNGARIEEIFIEMRRCSVDDDVSAG